MHRAILRPAAWPASCHARQLALLVAALALLASCRPNATRTAPRVEAISDVSIPFSAPPPSALTGKLYRPQGTGPFPAAVLMHGCSGLATGSTGMDNVALLLRESGYVALEVDSFLSRGVATVCDNPMKHPTQYERVDDAFAARRYLSSLSFVVPDRIALVGWSHGGTTALLTWARKSDEARSASFAAIAAYYPYCFINVAAYEDEDITSASAPLLILIGERDDWCPVAMCQSVMDQATKLGRDTSMTVYPGATHAFDSVSGGKPQEFMGHRLAPDPAAALASRERLLEFLDRTLKRKR
jgi:dienelactone hydrolase